MRFSGNEPRLAGGRDEAGSGSDCPAYGSITGRQYSGNAAKGASDEGILIKV